MENKALAKGINLNQRFGSLVVTGKIKRGNKTYMVCQCDCGEQEELTPDPIRTGSRVRCSACHHKWVHDRSHLKIDRTGQRFGKLTAVERLDPKDSAKERCSRYRCRCDCGNEVIVRDTGLTGGVSSCGCTRSGLQSKKGFSLPIDAAWNNIFSTYKSNAFKRGLLFELKLETLKVLCSSECRYCGCPPATKYWQKAALLSSERILASTMMVNGIDRLDPSLGYIDGNMAPCCKACNYAKLKMTETEFKLWIERVYLNLFKRGT
jgi:hypothetical protein